MVWLRICFSVVAFFYFGVEVIRSRLHYEVEVVLGIKVDR